MERTITSIFMVPTLNIPRDMLLNVGFEFINGYSIDKRRDVQYENAVYLLFKPKNLNKFRNFLDAEYERTKSIIEDYDYEDGYVVVAYQLNSEFKPDFDLIRTGKYSKTSTKFRALFKDKIEIKTNGLKKEEWSIQYLIFTKDKEMIKYWQDKLGVTFSKDQEVWSMFCEENETLNLDKIKEHV